MKIVPGEEGTVGWGDQKEKEKEKQGKNRKKFVPEQPSLISTTKIDSTADSRLENWKQVFRSDCKYVYTPWFSSKQPGAP